MRTITRRETGYIEETAGGLCVEVGLHYLALQRGHLIILDYCRQTSQHTCWEKRFVARHLGGF